VASEESYWAVHDAACALGEATYTDPETGYQVFTRLGLLARGGCCGAGCRHCPFDHANVKIADRSRRIQQAAWLTTARPDPACETALLFWSGGKDSFLAYRALLRTGKANIALLTTFDARSRMIAHQDFAIDRVVEQALHLDVPLIGVPLHPGVDYLDHLSGALDLVPECQRLCFGDLHLESIRGWREKSFAAHPRTADLALEFPLWKADYGALLDDLKRSGATCEVSAVAEGLNSIKISDRFDEHFVARLPEAVDPFGENGEFHTLIVF